MNATCFSGAIRDSIHEGIAARPDLADQNPASPVSSETTAMPASSNPTGFQRSPAPSFGREPTRATSDNGTPNISPTHHVAIVPQPNASNVGSSVANTGGWPIVKYSTQTRVVT